MKALWGLALVIALGAGSGCYDTAHHYYNGRKCPRHGKKQQNGQMCPHSSGCRQNAASCQQTSPACGQASPPCQQLPTCPTTPGSATPASAYPMMQTETMQPASFVRPSAYKTVYTTEYTPNGPVVRKALVPIYGNMPMLNNPNDPLGYPASHPLPTPNTVAMMVAPTYSGPGVPLPNPNCPPVFNQPYYSGAAETAQAVSWFGPASAPTFSTQTDWY